MCPVDRRVGPLERHMPPLQGTIQLGVDVEVLRKREERLVERFEAIPGWRRTPFSLGAGPGRGRHLGTGIGLTTHALTNPLKLVEPRLEKRLRVALADNAALDQIGGE